MNNEWRSLDNAAKIFPSAQNGSDTQVFRFSCELSEKIDAEALQKAVCESLDIFDMFRVVMRRGIFWYYLEKTDIEPIVREEYKTPCAAIYIGNREKLLFEVTYYNCRINLDIFHVLSDGTGAMNFLNSIVAIYLKICHNTADFVLDYDASKAQMKDDSFFRYYNKHKTKHEKSKAAYKLRGYVLPEDRMNIIVARMSVAEVLKASHACGATLTEFIGACFMEAIGGSMTTRAKRKDVVLSIPVNLRKYFPSESSANFFSLIFTSYNFSKCENSFDDIVKKVNSDFNEKLTEEKLLDNITEYSAIENNVFAKLVPLGIKDLSLMIAYKMSMRLSTAALSNIGRVKMPDELKQYIKAYDVYTGTGRMQICMCSFGDTLSVSFTTPLVSTEIQRLFFRKLSSLGIRCELITNAQGGHADEGV